MEEELRQAVQKGLLLKQCRQDGLTMPCLHLVAAVSTAALCAHREHVCQGVRQIEVIGMVLCNMAYSLCNDDYMAHHCITYGSKEGMHVSPCMPLVSEWSRECHCLSR